MTATFGAFWSSRSVKARPVTIGIPMTSKKLLEITSRLMPLSS
jgi:hypothetical protein